MADSFGGGDDDFAGEIAINRPVRHWMIPILVALIGAFMSILDSSIVNVAIATIMHVFSTTTSVVQWVSTIYLLALGVVVPMSGWLGDKLGFKRLYMLAMAVFVLGSMLCTLSWSINALIAARVIQALGGGMIMPTTMAMVYRMVPKDRIGRAMGIFGIALLVAPAIGPTLGGYLVEYVDWRWIFTINLPIGVIGLFLSYFLLPDFETVEAGRFDVPGAVTSAIGLFSLLLAFTKGPSWGWSSERIILLFYVGLSSLGLFVYLELTSPHPLLELRVFKYATFTFANLTIVVTVIGMYAGLFYLPLFLQTARGLGAFQTGLLMMPGALLSGLVMPLSGRLYDRIGPRWLVVGGLLLLAFLTFTFHRLTLYTSATTVMVWVMLRGPVIAFANMPAQTASIAVIPQELVGRASALTNIISRVSSSFGLAVLTSIMTNRTAFHTARFASLVNGSNYAAVGLIARMSAAFGGGARGHSATISYLFGIVRKLGYVQGIDDVFIVAAALTLIGVVPALFLKKGVPRGPMGAAEQRSK